MKGFLPWHQVIWSRLLTLDAEGRFPHALLFSGPHGVGKQQLAEALAARTLCRRPGEMACGKCHSCQMLDAGYHPDLMRVGPEEGKRQIRIDPIRDVNRFISQTAQQSGHRVILLGPADALNMASANALLKSLEEPGQNTLFILLSDLPSRVLPTLRSRCQQWPLAPVSFAASRDWLIEALGNEDEAFFWWRVAAGLPLLATELAAPEARDLRHRLHESFEQLMRGAEPVSEAARLEGQTLDMVLWYGIVWLEDLIRFGLSGDEAQVHNPDLVMLYRQAMKNARVQDWFRVLDFAREQRRLLAQGANPNPRLVLEAWLIRWATLLRS